MAALPHERPVTLTNGRTQMPKNSLIGNSLAYCLNQTRQCATDYRPGMTPEEVHAVYLRGERKKRAATRNSTGKERAVPVVAARKRHTRSSMVRPHLDAAAA